MVSGRGELLVNSPSTLCLSGCSPASLRLSFPSRRCQQSWRLRGSVCARDLACQPHALLSASGPGNAHRPFLGIRTVSDSRQQTAPQFFTPPEVCPALQTPGPQALAILCLLFPSRPPVCCPLACVRVGYFLPLPSRALSHWVCLYWSPDWTPALALGPHLFFTSGRRLGPG